MANGLTKEILRRWKDKRPPKKVTFAEWVFFKCYKSHKNIDKYKCLNCHGRGGIHDFRDRDVIEGYKGVTPRYPCHDCNSRGWVEMEDLRPYYRVYADQWKKDYDQWKDDFWTVGHILDKLDDEDIMWLEKNGF